MFDRDTYNLIKAEEKAYDNWEREEKNRIFRMNSTLKKQSAWNSLFPKFDYSNLSEEEITQPY